MQTMISKVTKDPHLLAVSDNDVTFGHILPSALPWLTYFSLISLYLCDREQFANLRILALSRLELLVS